MIPSNVLMISPDVLMVSFECTEHLNVLNTPDVLNIPRCTEHTLYRVLINMTKTIESTLDKRKYGFGVLLT